MQQADLEKLLADTLAAHGRSPRDTLMLRLFGRYLVERRIDKPIDAVAPEDVVAYQRHLVTVRKVGFSSFNQSTCALRFFYRTCLGKTDWTIARMPYQKKRRVLPEILSPEEIAAIFEACHNLKHKTLLMTSYSGGLRRGSRWPNPHPQRATTAATSAAAPALTADSRPSGRRQPPGHVR